MADLTEHSIFIKFCFKLVIRDFLMADLTEQSIFIQFSFKLEKTASETLKMLRTAFGDNAHGKDTDF